MATETLKRFYKSVTVEAEGAEWAVALDGRRVKTPAKTPLRVASRKLADALAEEWARQGETIDIQGMHLTRLVNVALDRTPQERAGLVQEVRRYCETDLLCFLAEDPAELRDRQIALWRPIRAWVGQALGIVLMEAPGGLLHMPQPPASLDVAIAYADALDNLRLTGLVFAMGLYGSALLAMAVEQGELTATAAYDLSILDELWQGKKWGIDAENEARQAAQRLEAGAVGTFFSALFIE
ncbi:MAG: ATP12 family protein [Pseudomonadota bacterium]